MIDDQTYEKTIRGAWFYPESWRAPEPAKQSRVQDCIDLGADSETHWLDADRDLDPARGILNGLWMSLCIAFGGIALGWLLARWLA